MHLLLGYLISILPIMWAGPWRLGDVLQGLWAEGQKELQVEGSLSLTDC